MRSQRKQGVTLKQITACQDCGGHGVIVDSPCAECAGRGRITRDETLKVRIPIGVEDGATLRVAGHGLPAEKPGAPPGDLFVVIRAAEDSRFERRGSDLYRTETIDVVDAVLGAKIDVPLLDGQTNRRRARRRAAGLGLEAGRQGITALRRGYARRPLRPVQVHVPEQLSDRQRRLFERLKATYHSSRKPIEPP